MRTTTSGIPTRRQLASVSVISLRTRASVGVDTGHAGRAIQTWSVGARVDLDGAEFSGETRGTRAVESIGQVAAGSPIGAGQVQTLVDVVLTQRTDEPWSTPTLEVVNLVIAHAAIQTWVVCTLVAVVLATVAKVTNWTHAPEPVQLVDATSA